MVRNNIRNCEDTISNNKYIGWIYQSWIGSLPSEIRLSKSLRNVRLPLGLIIQLASLSMFLYFFISGIETTKNASFLSLDKTAGDCDDVKISISDTYFVDYNGYWSTSPDYDDSKATFKVQFVSVEMNDDEYTHFTKNVIYPYLKNLNMGNKNWAENFLIWSKSETFEFEYGGGKVFVSIMGTSFNYQNDYYLQDCDLSGSCSQNVGSTSSMYTMLDKNAYSSIMKSYFMNQATPFTQPDNSDKICVTQPDNSGTNGAFAGYGTNIYMVDNSGGSNDYTMIPYTQSSSNSPPWYFSYLTLSGGMGSLSTLDYCSDSFTSSYIYYYIPIIGTGLFSGAQGQNSGTYYNTFSANSADCNVCSENMNPDCNDPSKLSLYIGLLEISYPNNVQCQSYDANSGIYSDCAFDNFYTQKMLNQRNMLGEKLFPLIDIMNTNYDITTLINDPTLQEYIDFNTISKIRLTQFTAENIGVYYESLNLNTGLTANDIQLSCSDSLGTLGPFNPDSDASNNPPTQLTEKYYVCTPSASNAFLDSFGIASSNTATFMGIFITLMITGYIQYVKYTSKREISAVSSDDISSAIEMLGTAIVNRNIQREKNHTLPSGTITAISNELIDEEKAIEDGMDVELASVKNPYAPEKK